jgi:hypothetical protein
LTDLFDVYRHMDGRDFSAISEAEFSILVGQDPGNLLWSHFALLTKTGMATVPSTFQHKNTFDCSKIVNKPVFDTSLNVNKNKSDSSKIVDKTISECRVVKRSFDETTTHLAEKFVPVKKQRVILGKYEEGKVFLNSDDSSNVHRSGNNGNNVQLWKFLLDILTDFKHR